MTYRFKWRRCWLWKSVAVIGHRWDQPQDKMVLYFPDGGQRELRRWTKCEVQLGTDWVVAMKKHAESQAGVAVPLNV